MKTHKDSFKFQRCTLNFIIICLVNLSCSILCLSQTRPRPRIDPIRLQGVWEGTIVTTFKTEVTSLPVLASFTNGRITLNTPSPQTGSYSVNGDNVRVSFDDDENDPFTLVGVELTNRELKAKVRVKNDIPSVTSVLSLLRVRNGTAHRSSTRNSNVGLFKRLQPCSSVVLTPEFGSNLC